MVISFIKGYLLQKDLQSAILDVNGIGYEIFMPLTDISSLGSEGEFIEVHVYTHVREDILRLFGFKSKKKKFLFQKLISVSGIGPKIGLAVLSELNSEDFIKTVQGDDYNTLKKIPGIGKKTAQRICLELRDKLQLSDSLSTQQMKGDELSYELSCALESLGYKTNQIEKALKNLESDDISKSSLEDLVRSALQYLKR